MFENAVWVIWSLPICMGTTLLITVTLAYVTGHVTYYVPYISDTGTVPPESCYFGQGLNMLWIIVSTIHYVKFLQVRYIVRLEQMQQIEILNKITLTVGWLGGFGVSMVANFQELPSMKIHWTGAFITFGCGSVYTCLQTCIYYKLNGILGEEKRFILRVLLSIVSLVTFFIFYIGGLISLSKFKGEDILKWKKTDSGFEIHEISAIAEWISATCILIYLFTFYFEFKNINLSQPTVIVKLKTDRAS